MYYRTSTLCQAFYSLRFQVFANVSWLLGAFPQKSGDSSLSLFCALRGISWRPRGLRFDVPKIRTHACRQHSIRRVAAPGASRLTSVNLLSQSFQFLYNSFVEEQGAV